MNKLTLLNAPILTAHGDFRFAPLSLAEAKELVRQFQNENKPIESAIGHAATAEILSELLEISVATNRIEFHQTNDDAALIFKLKTRIAEGKVLNREEIEQVGYEFGLLMKNK